MTMRNRQIMVAAGLIILIVWLLLAWLGPTTKPQPSAGPSPTGAIGSGPFTFGPSDSVSPTSTGGTPGASLGASPGVSGSTVSTPAPGATAVPADAVRWTGTWTNTSPDDATGSLEVIWTQDGSALEGTLSMTGGSCFTEGGFQGTIVGDKVQFGVVGRDQVAFEGTISGDRISGTFTISCDTSQGTWEATRQP